MAKNLANSVLGLALGNNPLMVSLKAKLKAHIQQYARLECHTQLAKISFDEIFDLIAGVHFNVS